MNAALINGTMGHILDFDDDHREGTMHPNGRGLSGRPLRWAEIKKPAAKS